MTDVLTKKQRSYCMSRIKSGNTQTELNFRKYIWKRGLRNYRIKNKVFGKPDIYFPKRGVAVFIDGCFWHKCPKCFKKPKSNVKFWENKIKKNKKRDILINRSLKKEGVKVIRFWEHEIKENPKKCFKRLVKILKKPTVVDLFCGAGGLSAGFQQAGYIVLFGIDNVEIFTKTFRENHPSAEVVFDDIENIDAKRIKKIIGNLEVDVVVGGPPCQGFSMAGRRDPKDPRNSLFTEFVKIVNGLRPKFFVMENVPGLLSTKTASGKPVKDIILNEFKKIGYEVKEPHLLLVANYGVPQMRRRIFFAGTKLKRDFRFPPINTHAKEPTLFGQKKWTEVGKVLLPKSCVDKSYFHSKKMISGFINRKKRNIARGNGFGWQILDPKKLSYTISARYWKDGGDAIVRYRNGSARMLTSLECARIQGFPDSFNFKGSKREVYTQIGNAVPPPVAKAIAEEIKKKLV